MNDAGGVRDPAATLDAWREQGRDRLDPVRFHFLQALARRAAGQVGAARRMLDERLATLMAAYERDLAGATAPDAPAPAPVAPAAGLGELLRYIASLAPEAPAVGDKAAGDTAGLAPELLDYFRDTWSRLSVKKRLRQSREQVPENAGPLNSSQLVHRALSLMRDTAPEYLHLFLSYADTLSWMDRLNGGLAPARESGRADGPKRAARGRQE